MSGLIANAPVNVAAPVQISSGAFWPAVDVAQLRDRLRLDHSVTDGRLLHAVSHAIATVNRELETWRQTQSALGLTALDKISDQQINGLSIHTLLYLRAIDGFVCAEIADRYRGYDATRSGDQRAEVVHTTSDDYRRDARFAIRDLLGKPRMTVDLI